jgi:hypothetical protein
MLFKIKKPSSLMQIPGEEETISGIRQSPESNNP